MPTPASQPDVIVVGAGPAGATAARTLARSGKRVLVIDRARFPRNKPCGGAVSVRALNRFPYLRPALERISTRWLSRLELESPSGDHASLTSPRPAALMIRRVEFDNLLVQLAVDAGAELCEGVEITRARETKESVLLRTRDGREFAAPFVIAADGVNGMTTRRLGLNPGWAPTRVAIDMMEETPNDRLRSLDPDAMWVAYGYGGSEGYAYVFPKAAHVNVGIGYVLEYYRSRVEAHPWDLQRRFVGQLQGRTLLAGESSRRHFTPFMIPVGGPLPDTATRRVMAAGDAGGFVNGITAEGIYYAMVTGDLAGRAAAAGDPARYRRLWRREIGAELRDAVLVQRHLLATPRRIDRLVAAARHDPTAANVIISYAMGDISYFAARRWLIARSPRLAFKLFWEALRLRRGRAGAPVTEPVGDGGAATRL